jgi:DNA-binding response OmpR family regulator
MMVLVVDDELPMRVALVESLKGEGYRVSAASDGEEALEVVFAGEFDLVLLDVMMPKLDGFSVCAEMRKRGVKIPVLMLTVRGTIDDRVAGLDCGADDYLVKPFSLKELLARVRALLRREERAAVPDQVELKGVKVDFGGLTCEFQGETAQLSVKEGGC